MYRSAINLYEKPEKAMAMREALSASPSGSSAQLQAADSTAAAAAALSPTQPQRCLCLNCHNQMKVPEQDQMRTREDTDQVEEDGRTRNLIEFIASATVPMDAPVCKECADDLQSGMKRQMEMLENDCLKYDALINDLRNKHSSVDAANYKAQIDRLKQDEDKLTEELRNLILEEEKVDRKLAAEKAALEQTSAQEEELWGKLRDYHAYVLQNDQEVREVNMEIRYIESQVKMLTRTNVLTLAFPIDTFHYAEHSLPIGQINGFRLGRIIDLDMSKKNATQIDWPEINAAWGQALLLLDILMKRAHCTLPETEFVTLHGASSIRRGRQGGNVREYPLHSSGGWRPFGNRNMDAGACLFLEALALLCKTITENSRANGVVPVEFPRRIRGDKMVENDMEYTVKMQFNSEERWTKAMHAMLLDLKWAATMTDL